MLRIKKIEIHPVAHHDQRYDTVGDWIPLVTEGGEGVVIAVSDTGDDDHLLLVGIHELIEWYLCRKRGITDEVVSAFDKKCLAEDYPGEPGDHPDAPYRAEHQIATEIERKLAEHLGVDWDDYSDTIEAL